MPVPIQRPTGGKSWGLLGYLKDFISPPGYVSRGPLGSRSAAAATLQGRAPTDAELKAQGYGFGVREYDPLETGRRPGVQVAPPASVLPAPVTIPAGTVQPTAIIKGLTPTGQVDYSQGDEYKAQMAQYQNMINQKKTQEAEDLGMKIWMQKYGNTAMGQAGGAVGAKNPLLAATFPETGGYASTFTPVEDYQMGDLGTRAQGEMGPTMETLNPLASQAAQQEATATQADMATTAGMSTGDRARNLTRAFRLGMM